MTADDARCYCDTDAPVHNSCDVTVKMPRPTAVAALIAAALFAAACTDDRPSDPPTTTPETPASAASTPFPTAAPAPTASPTAVPSPVPPTPTPVFVPTPVILPTVAVPLPLPRRPATDPAPGLLDSLEGRASLIRSLFPVRPIERNFIDREELGERMQSSLNESADEIESQQALYRTLGILASDQSLLDILIPLYSENVLGFYDTDEEGVYLVGQADELSPRDQLTYVHEYVHGLQQQHFDIGGTLDSLEGDSDRRRAFRGLVEGDASVAEILFMLNYFDESEQAQARTAPSAAADRAYRQAPHVVRRTFAFPYVEGFRFIVGLYTQIEAWDLVDDAYPAPPQSTEQIIHPEKYRSGERPLTVELPDLAPVLQGGWREVITDTFGEFLIQAYMEMHLPPESAAMAAAGWGGDRFSLYEDAGGETLLYALLRWDSDEDAAEFFEAFLHFSRARTDAEWQPAAQDDDTQRLLRLEGQVIYLGLAEARTLLIIAPDEQTLDALRAL